MIRHCLIKNIKLINRNFTTSITKLNKEYNNSGEWLLKDNDSTKIGISKDSADQMGELVYIEPMFDKGDNVDKDEELVALESVKATESINAPFDCMILENNDIIIDDPSIINKDPENVNDAWFIKIKEK